MTIKNKELLNELRLKNNAQKELIKTQQKQAAMRIENIKRKHIIDTKK